MNRTAWIAALLLTSSLGVVSCGSGPDSLIGLRRDAPMAAAPGSDADLIAEALDLTDGDRWMRTVRELSGRLPVKLSTGETVTLTSRHSSTTGNTQAGQYIFDRLKALGYEVRFQTFQAPTGTERNVVATKPGTTRAGEIVVLGAHYDSTAQSADNAPGADDNASGVATMLEAATALAGYRLDRTVEFVAFGAEEQGLYGSSAFVQQAKDDREDVQVAVICDMVGWWEDRYAIVIEGGLRYAGWMQIAADATQTWSGLEYRRSWYSFGSDHVPFQNAHIPAFLVIEDEWYKAPHYHSSADTADVVDPDYGLDITHAVAATVAEAAGLEGRQPKLSGAALAAPPYPEAPIVLRAGEAWSPEALGETCRLHSEDEPAEISHGL